MSDPAREVELRQAALALAADPQLLPEIRLAFRVLDQEANILSQFGGLFQDYITVLEGGELPERPSFREFLEAEMRGVNTSGSTDSAGTG